MFVMFNNASSKILFGLLLVSITFGLNGSLPFLVGVSTIALKLFIVIIVLKFVQRYGIFLISVEKNEKIKKFANYLL